MEPKEEQRISDISEAICLELLPDNDITRNHFSQDINCQYSGEEIVYIIQHLSEFILGIIAGLTTSFLYDAIKNRLAKKDLAMELSRIYDEKIQEDISRIEKKINEINAGLSTDDKSNIYYQIIINDYKKTIDNIKSKPEFLERIEELLLKYSKFSEEEIKEILQRYDGLTDDERELFKIFEEGDMNKIEEFCKEIGYDIVKKKQK